MAVVVRFNSVGEFLDELRKSKPFTGIVRVTFASKSPLSPNIKQIYVVSSFLIVHDSFKGEIIVRLETYCGETWGVNAEMDKEIEDKAKAIAQEVANTARQIGCEVRAGVFDQPRNGLGENIND